MLFTTGWCLRTWLKVTVLLAVAVLLVGVFCGFDSTQFYIGLIAAAVLDLLTIRGLVREWLFEARGSWWWFG
jgi:hypothetical protein